jgi:dihydropteroate synthase
MLGAGQERPLVMGVLNVTPDSFYDGGRYATVDAAVAHGRAMLAAGADVVDVGGESSRPGAHPVPEAEELRRVLPVVRVLAEEGPVSVDTVKPAVARAAAEAGAVLLNDVSGTLAPVAAECGLGWVAMHRQGTPADMQVDPRYDDVVGEVHGHVLALAAAARTAGVSEVWVDPGIGFGKTVAHNLALLAHLGELVEAADRIGARVLVGTSNKRFLGVVGTGDDRPLEPSERAEASLASAVWAMAQGVDMVRVHDVGPSVQAARLVGPRSRAVSPVGASGGMP